MELISREAAKEAFYHIRCNLQMMDDTQTADKTMKGLWLAENAVEMLPTIEGRKGKWIEAEAFRGYASIWECSECHSLALSETPYCAYCGSFNHSGGTDTVWIPKDVKEIWKRKDSEAHKPMTYDEVLRQEIQSEQYLTNIIRE